MDEVVRTTAVAASATLMIALQFITLIAMVVAPDCTGIGQQATIYKFASILVCGSAYYALVWRRNSLNAALLIPVAQIASGWLFLGYIDSLPMTCP